MNLDDTTHCPITDMCQGCGARLDVGTAQTTLGVLCMTLCATCAQRPLPSLTFPEAARAVVAHCGHLGVDLDDMLRGMADDE